MKATVPVRHRDLGVTRFQGRHDTKPERSNLGTGIFAAAPQQQSVNPAMTNGSSLLGDLTTHEDGHRLIIDLITCSPCFYKYSARLRAFRFHAPTLLTRGL